MTAPAPDNAPDPTTAPTAPPPPEPADRLREAEAHLAEARAALDRSERLRAIDNALLRRGVIDLETARLVGERAIGAMETPDAEAMAAEMQRSKPFLFRREPATPVREPVAASAMAPHAPQPPRTSAADTARRAAMTGDRAELLRYLRLRRAV